MTRPRARPGTSILGCLAALMAGASSLPAQGAAPAITVQQVVADSTAFDVTATLVIGPRHVVLFDAQYHKADAERVAAAIAKTGRPLQAIVLSHADEDHVSGIATILERFPGTPVYMTRAALAVFDSTAPARFTADRTRNPALFPDSLVRPVEFPSTTLSLDGVAIELIPDLQGDVRIPTNTALWIPSTRTLLAGDILFRGVHPWLGSSDPASRASWRASIVRLAALKPAVVIAGHKASPDAPDTPEVLQAMDRYLAAFDSVRLRSTTPRELLDAMLARYPDYKVRGLLSASAAMAFPRGAPATGAGTSPAGGGMLPIGTWTGSMTGPASAFPTEFVVGRSDGKLTLQLRPEGPPPIDASDVAFDGAALTFVIDLGGRRLACRLSRTPVPALEGSCGENGADGPLQVKMVPPRPAG